MGQGAGRFARRVPPCWNTPGSGGTDARRVLHTSPKSIRKRLLSYFSECIKRTGSYEFDIPYNRQQLADYLNVERSGLSLELGKMRDEGLLDFHKSHFILKV